MPSARSKVEVGPTEARYYDLFLSLISLGQYSHFIKRVVDLMDIDPGQSILDLGSGTGRNDCFMAEKVGSQGRIVGLDISNEMLGRAWKRCRGYPNMIFERRRIEIALPYREAFDKVFISFVLHGFENDQKKGIIRNAYRALKAGGSFYILDYAQFDMDRMWFPLRWAFARWECQLAVEFLKLDIKKMLGAQGFTDFKEAFFFRRHVRLLRAVKHLIRAI